MIDRIKNTERREELKTKLYQNILKKTSYAGGDIRNTSTEAEEVLEKTVTLQSVTK